MTIRLKLWEPKDGDYKRVFVDGLEGAEGAFLHLKHGQIEVEGSGIGGRRVIDAVQEALGLQLVDFDEIVEAARASATERPEGPKAGPDRGSRLDAIDAEALKLTKRNRGIPVPTRLLASRDEPDHMIKRLSRVPNLSVEVADLPYGHYLVPGFLVVERQRVDHFRGSVASDAGGLFRGLAQLGSGEETAMLIVEGDMFIDAGFDLASLAGALSHIATGEPISVIPTLSPMHTAYMISKAVRHRLFGPARPSRIPQWRMGVPDRVSESIIAAVPGMAFKRARRLVAAFGSVAAIAAASREELEERGGASPQQAERLHAALNGLPLPRLASEFGEAVEAKAPDEPAP